MSVSGDLSIRVATEKFISNENVNFLSYKVSELLHYSMTDFYWKRLQIHIFKILDKPYTKGFFKFSEFIGLK